MKVIQNSQNINSHSAVPHMCKWSVWNNRIDITDNCLVLFNAYTHGAVLMESVEYADPTSLDVADKEMLHANGILVDAEIDEKARWAEEYDRGRKDMSYIDLTIMLTEDCQMRCQYCFEGSKKKNTIRETTIERVLAFLKRYVGVCSRLRVTWFGGEPLIAYKHLKSMTGKLIDFCRENNISYSADITTNGYAMSPTRCHELVHELNVKRFIITIDGPERIHEQRRPLVTKRPTFNVIMRNIETLIENGAFVSIRMTIDRGNVDYVPEFLNYLAESPLKGRVGLAFCRTIDYNFTPDNIKELLFTEREFTDVEWYLIQHAHKLGIWRYHFPHSAPLGGCLRQGDIVVGVDGKVYKCLDTLGDERWITGSIDDDSNSPEWLKRWHQWTPFDNDKCASCPLVPLCNGGCPHNALFDDKRHGTDTGCPDWKGNYKRQIKSLILENYEKF